nr:kinesin-like protein KIN-4A [Tanacetum cinerariifolium]
MDKELHELNKPLEQKKERDRLQAEIQNLSATSDGQTQKLQDLHSHKLKSLESQIQDLKKKKDSQVSILKQKQKTDEEAKKFQNEI